MRQSADMTKILSTGNDFEHKILLIKPTSCIEAIEM